jgi:dTDP-glucose 4,6-dehydratase
VARVLITGGAGFIGARFAARALERFPHWQVVVLDRLTYAGSAGNLGPAARHPRLRLVVGDIADAGVVAPIFRSGLDWVFHFAAESHVDRSIADSADFLRTGAQGTQTLLEAARRWPVRRFVHVSTDEVYGSVPRGTTREDAPLRPSSPYAAAKAASDLLALAFRATHGVPVVITRSSNTYGPRQHPEKMIPLFVTNALDGLPLPLYGDGRSVRDWLHVDDHCAALETVAERGKPGAIYHIGAGRRRTNLSVARAILRLLGRPESLLRRVADRPGHDRRYALDCTRLRRLGWRPRVRFEAGLASTVDWYRRNRAWWEPLRRGAQAAWFERHYGAQFASPRCSRTRGWRGASSSERRHSRSARSL